MTLKSRATCADWSESHSWSTAHLGLELIKSWLQIQAPCSSPDLVREPRCKTDSPSFPRTRLCGLCSICHVTGRIMTEVSLESFPTLALTDRIIKFPQDHIISERWKPPPEREFPLGRFFGVSWIGINEIRNLCRHPSKRWQAITSWVICERDDLLSEMKFIVLMGSLADSKRLSSYRSHVLFLSLFLLHLKLSVNFFEHRI